MRYDITVNEMQASAVLETLEIEDIKGAITGNGKKVIF